VLLARLSGGDGGLARRPRSRGCLGKPRRPTCWPAWAGGWSPAG